MTPFFFSLRFLAGVVSVQACVTLGLKDLCHEIYQNSNSVSAHVRESGILGFGIRNTAQGIRNPTNDWNPESNFYCEILESSTWNPESTT